MNALVIPTRLDEADVAAVKLANPTAFLVVAQGDIPTEEPSANRHVWLTVISVVRGLLAAGKVAGIFTGPLIPVAATVLGMGLDEAEQAILKAPEVEDWTPTRIAAARAAVKDPTT
ncbi:MAG: hypothetical protein Q8P41_31580 [Pseudomonadota bacterium]|nr:hypothetical protein [Pseudomonadota bacterium]